MNHEALKIWHKLGRRERQDIFNQVSAETNLSPAAIEKDWWVVRTLELVFDTSVAPHTVFKGGTSLSKAWGIIDRFSEDIDLAMDKAFLGFGKEMTNTQVKKLRRKSFEYMSGTFFPELQEKFSDAGFAGMTIRQGELKDTDQDPVVIEIYYTSVTEQTTYLQPRILVEVGSRSLIEPYSPRPIVSMVGDHFSGRPFADKSILIPTVNPERTFLEKIFLLHEEFQRQATEIRVNRRSRHLYDLERLMDTDYADEALNNMELYNTIVRHRKIMTPVRGIDYENHVPESISLIPPDEVIGEWEKDYRDMQESMFYKPAPEFGQLIERIKILNQRINNIAY